MKIQFKGDTEFKAKLSKAQRSLLTRKTMGLMALKGKELIEEHTQEGKDKKGNSFEPYSDTYLDFKERRGGGWLDDEGKMLGNLSFKVLSSQRAYLNFPKGEENLKASGHVHGSRILPQRDFFGLNNLERKLVLDVGRDELKKVIDAVNR